MDIFKIVAAQKWLLKIPTTAKKRLQRNLASVVGFSAQHIGRYNHLPKSEYKILNAPPIFKNFFYKTKRSMEEKSFTPQQSLDLIQQMIAKAQNSYHDTGIGPILWGCVISICSLVTYLKITLGFKLPFDIWLLTLVAIVPQIIIVAREKKLNKVRSHDETTMDYLWSCFGISIFILTFINANIASALQPIYENYKLTTGNTPSIRYSNFLSSLFLLLYGFPTIITGGIRKFKPMLYGGIFCWVAAVIAVYTSAGVDMLLTAFAAIAAWLVPGIILYRNHQKRRVANV